NCLCDNSDAGNHRNEYLGDSSSSRFVNLRNRNGSFEFRLSCFNLALGDYEAANLRDSLITLSFQAEHENSNPRRDPKFIERVKSRIFPGTTPAFPRMEMQKPWAKCKEVG